jgi:hypothetical protein
MPLVCSFRGAAEALGVPSPLSMHRGTNTVGISGGGGSFTDNDRCFPLPCPATVDTAPADHSSPPISIGDYVQRFVKFADPGFEGMVLALVLTERLTNKVGP